MFEEGSRIAVAPGFTWTAAGAWASFFALVGLIVKQWVPIRKIRIDEFQSVINAQAGETERLSERVATLEREMRDQRDRYEQMLAFERASHEAELGLQRHATRGTKQILAGLLDLIEVAPEKAMAHATKMRKRMEELESAEKVESATIRGAKIIATTKNATQPAVAAE